MQRNRASFSRIRRECWRLSGLVVLYNLSIPGAGHSQIRSVWRSQNTGSPEYRGSPSYNPSVRAPALSLAEGFHQPFPVCHDQTVRLHSRRRLFNPLKTEARRMMLLNRGNMNIFVLKCRSRSQCLWALAILAVATHMIALGVYVVLFPPSIITSLPISILTGWFVLPGSFFNNITGNADISVGFWLGLLFICVYWLVVAGVALLFLKTRRWFIFALLAVVLFISAKGASFTGPGDSQIKIEQTD